jgi:hypothetical protein
MRLANNHNASRVVPDEDPLGFDFVDLGKADDKPTTQDPEFEDPPPLIPRELSVPEETQDPESHCHPDSTRWLARNPNPPQCLIETEYVVLDESDAIEDYETQLLAEDPIVFAASKSHLEILNVNDVVSADDLAEFKKAMLGEVNAHTENDHWEVWEKAKVPAGQDVLLAVWAFKWKQQIDVHGIYKYKARLNIHGGLQKHGVN